MRVDKPPEDEGGRREPEGTLPGLLPIKSGCKITTFL
jgi:hypothetical protein